MKPALELSTRFSCVSTSPKSKHYRAPSHAMKLLSGYATYCCRPDAAAGFVAVGRLLDKPQDVSHTRRQISSLARGRVQRGGSVGVRVFERGIVSLPNDFTDEQAALAMRRFLTAFVPAHSDACAFAVLHNDKPGNKHFHFVAVDGLENPTLTQARKLKRARPRDALRMGDRGAPQRVRELAAVAINSVADEFGKTRVEHLSFKSRGLSLEPSKHDGPARRRLGYATRSSAPSLSSFCQDFDEAAESALYGIKSASKFLERTALSLTD